MSIEERNKLIAEFMGIQVSIDAEGVNYKDKLVTGLPVTVYVNYHTSWNWLMQVVQKILSLDAGMNTYQLYVSDSLLYAKIEKVYSAVAQFIHWHNEHPQTS